VLAEFRLWLRQLPAAAPPAAAASDPIDLRALLGQFTALRHEINLQTRAARTQQEQAAEALRQTGEALGALKTARADTPSADDEESLRPLLKTLVDLYDALARTGRELERVGEGIVEALEPLLEAPGGPLAEIAAALARAETLLGEPRALSFGARWFGPARPAGDDPVRQILVEQQARLQTLQDQPAQERVEQVQQMFESLVTGYEMSLQRLDRALQQHGLEPIPTEGQPFDPERMEVLEVVADPSRPNGEVIEEMRRGYLWRDRVFRYALVRVAKS
jgi:molecular chaperone GrpE